jgi:DNA-binding PadR family transcriptional regulator
MKFNLYINQAKAIELGIKNINQAHIFDMLSMASTWATPIEIDGTYYYWVSRQIVCRELELLNIKPDTVYRHLKALADLGLIDYKKSGVKDCIAITSKGKTYFSDTMSEINPNASNPYVGNESESTRKQIRISSEMNPIYPTTKHPTTNILVSGQFDEFWSVYPVKQKKKEAKIMWQKHNLDSIATKIIGDVTNRVAKDKNWSEGYIPHPTTYLNNERWEDEIQIKTNDQIKGTCSNISDSTKVNAVWHKFEKAGYQPKEIWTVDGSDIQPWALDAYMKGNIESKLLGMAK